MARKDTYWSKNKDLFPDANAANNPVVKNIPIDPLIKQEYEEGKILLIDKPLHWTSFDIVRKLRSLLKIKKIGHAGTLDPLATGLLIICTGKFTKKVNEYMAEEKEYTGHFTLGAVTPTYDLESEPEQHKDYSFVTIDLLNSTIKKFTGEIEQLPPLHSAIKKDGIRLYKIARKGEEVILEPRKVTINHFEITSVDLPVVEFRVACTTGTYIRSLANDVGAALGCGVYLSKLRRTRIGNFNVANAQTIDQFTQYLHP